MTSIPNEAVIAAAKVLYADKISNHAGDNAPQIIAACEAVARKALEAASSALMARSFEEGYGLGYSDCVWSKGHEPRARNPYRSAGAGE